MTTEAITRGVLTMDANEAFVRLELAGQLPPGYQLKEKPRSDPEVESWGWVYEGADGRSQQTVGTKGESFAAAWSRFWRIRLGEYPPGYAVGRGEEERWVWTLAEEDRVSLPRDSREETVAETWIDWKAKLVGGQRPPCRVNENEPMAIMSRFQQASFQFIAIDEQIEAMKQRRDHLKKEMKHLAKLFTRVMMERQARDSGEKQG